MLDEKLLETYTHCCEFGNLILVEKNDKCGIIDKNYNIVQEAKYDKIVTIGDKYGYVYVNNKQGVINKNGNQICDVKYDNISHFIDGYYKVKLNEKWGVMDNEGREIIPIKYDTIYYDCNSKDFYKVKLGDENFYIDINDKEYNQIVNYVER